MLKLEGRNIIHSSNICNEVAMYRFIKSYRKFGDPCSRLQEIAADASLNCKQSQLKKLAQTLHTSCVEAEQKSLTITQSTANGNGGHKSHQVMCNLFISTQVRSNRLSL